MEMDFRITNMHQYTHWLSQIKTTYCFHTLQSKTYSEFNVDSSIELTLPKLVYHSPWLVLCLYMQGTDTHLRHTQVLVKFDQKWIFYDN